VSCRFSGNNSCVPEGRLPFYFSPLLASLLHIRIILDIVIGRASLKIP
jgi:hypothetical protein